MGRLATLPVLVTATASLVEAAAFLATGVVLRRRRYSAELRSAGQAYVVWWWALGLQALTDFLRIILAVGGEVPVEPYLWLARLKILLAGAGVWALGRYVLFLWNGRTWASVPIFLLALAHAVFFLYALQVRLPAHVAVDTWSPRLVLGGPDLAATSLGPFFLWVYFLPPIALALAYLLLVRRMETRTQRFRVLSIALAILVFQVVSAIQFDPNTPADSPAFAVYPLVSAAMALAVLATYVPPAWLARPLRIEGLPRDSPPS